MKIEDVEDSMHNICNQGEITKIKGINRSSKVVRLEESKYIDEEANHADICPKIRIVEYDSFSSISRNKSNLSAIAPLGLDKKLKIFANNHYEITPKSARPAISSPQEILSSIENKHIEIVNSEVLNPTWKKKSIRHFNDDSYNISRCSANSGGRCNNEYF